MVQTAAEEKKDVTSANAQQSFSNTELRIASIVTNLVI